jgi:phage gpG-like protein
MLEFKVIEDSWARTRKDLRKMAGRIKDMRPVFKRFIKYYQETIIPASFDTQGKLMGRSWAKLSPAYRKKKKPGSKMKRTETLYRAAQGGDGWYEKMTKKNLVIGLFGPIYAAVHQYGYPKRNIPRRDYFLTTKNDFPPKAWSWLLMEAGKEIKGNL